MQVKVAEPRVQRIVQGARRCMQIAQLGLLHAFANVVASFMSAYIILWWGVVSFLSFSSFLLSFGVLKFRR